MFINFFLKKIELPSHLGCFHGEYEAFKKPNWVKWWVEKSWAARAQNCRQSEVKELQVNSSLAELKPVIYTVYIYFKSQTAQCTIFLFSRPFSFLYHVHCQNS